MADGLSFDIDMIIGSPELLAYASEEVDLVEIGALEIAIRKRHYESVQWLLDNDFYDAAALPELLGKVLNDSRVDLKSDMRIACAMIKLGAGLEHVSTVGMLNAAIAATPDDAKLIKTSACVRFSSALADRMVMAGNVAAAEVFNSDPEAAAARTSARQPTAAMSLAI